MPKNENIIQADNESSRSYPQINVALKMSDEQEAEYLKRFNTDFRARHSHGAKELGAVISDLSKVSVVVKLNNGTQDGRVLTVSQTIGTLNTDRYDDQKAMNIVGALETILSKTIYNVQEVKTSLLTNS